MVAGKRGRPPKDQPEEIDYEMLNALEETKTQEEMVKDMFQVDSAAYSVVRNGDVFQLVRVGFNRESLTSSTAEVILESTDRWEVQAQFNVYTDNEFLMKDDL